MKDFNYIPSLTSHAVELVKAYERFVSGEAGAFEKKALEQAFRAEKCKGITDAIEAKKFMPVAEFGTMLTQYSKYIQVQQFAAINHLRENIPDEALVSFVKVGTTSVAIQKRVGFKREAFLNYFGLPESKNHEFYKLGCQFWDTRVRKLINDVLNKNKIANVKVVVSEIYRVQNRNMFNIDVNFQVKPEHLTADVVEQILRVCDELEQIVQNHK